jgi:alpha-D-ribose 1-methylphosphonate 5-triphosphate synthase subunit PhnH
VDFHCGARRVGAVDFVLADALPDLAGLDAGSDECPERSVTVILQVAALGRGDGFTLAGPGLAGPGRFLVEGLPGDFVARWAANHGLYPRGVDLILCAGTQMAALPRSVSVGG